MQSGHRVIQTLPIPRFDTQQAATMMMMTPKTQRIPEKGTSSPLLGTCSYTAAVDADSTGTFGVDVTTDGEGE